MTNKDVITAFYQKALTVNAEYRPEAILAEILADDFVSKGSVELKNKQQLIGQLGFFWQLIPNLEWSFPFLENLRL